MKISQAHKVIDLLIWQEKLIKCLLQHSISRPRSKTMLESSQPFIDGAERVSMLRVLGVMLNSRHLTSEHVSQVLCCACATSILPCDFSGPTRVYTAISSIW